MSRSCGYSESERVRNATLLKNSLENLLKTEFLGGNPDQHGLNIWKFLASALGIVAGLSLGHTS